MALTKQGWSISGLSVELGIDLRTLCKHIHRVQPVRVDGNVKLYRLDEVVSLLREQFGIPTLAKVTNISPTKS